MRGIETRAALVAALAMATSVAHGQEAAGDWHGRLQVSGVELRIGVTIEGPTGTLRSPDQGPGMIPIQDVVFEGGRLTFAVPAIKGRFEGQWDAARAAWSGKWIQGQTIALVLEKGPLAEVIRPQVPAKPYPYREEEVGFDSAPGVKLSGTLTTPPGAGPFPAAVLITGSGPQDRDESLLGHQPFLVLADALTRRGIAVLRYDDRGVGRSTGNHAAAVSADFAVDAAAAASFLRMRSEIDPRRIGLIGHSEGGLIAPMVAQLDPKIAFLVLLAGPAVPGHALMNAQRRAISGVMGISPQVAARNEAVVARIDSLIAESKDVTVANAEVLKILTAAAVEAGVDPKVVIAQSALLTTPWYRAFVAYDPVPALARLRIPVLALHGSNDLQVVPAQNVPAMRAALRRDHAAQVVELPGLNHLFQTSATGDPREYGRIEETFAPVALKTIADWVVTTTRR